MNESRKMKWKAWLRVFGGVGLMVLCLHRIIYGWGAVLPTVLGLLGGVAFLVKGVRAIRSSTPADPSNDEGP
jgi:hypothetical protein